MNISKRYEFIHRLTEQYMYAELRGFKKYQVVYAAKKAAKQGIVLSCRLAQDGIIRAVRLN